ncbi:hypothetical protein [Kiloniella sp.]|uniref:hypothetical protein n=1 Tax=Kiloniella sp. TaxID=1938587 RepID=UPI003B028227
MTKAEREYAKTELKAGRDVEVRGITLYPPDPEEFGPPDDPEEIGPMWADDYYGVVHLMSDNGDIDEALDQIDRWNDPNFIHPAAPLPIYGETYSSILSHWDIDPCTVSGLFTFVIIYSADEVSHLEGFGSGPIICTGGPAEIYDPELDEIISRDAFEKKTGIKLNSSHKLVGAQ